MSDGLSGCFVTGTDTGVGKTVVAAAIVARLRQLGVAARPVWLADAGAGLPRPPMSTGRCFAGAVVA